MARLYAQATEPVLITTASLAISASVSGSAHCDGYARLVGQLWSNASAAAGAASGLTYWQSCNGGLTWDSLSASQAISASTSASINLTITGNAIKVHYWNGATAASLFRAHFQLYPV